MHRAVPVRADLVIGWASFSGSSCSSNGMALFALAIAAVRFAVVR
jgi:hypothetical protein